MIKFTCQPPHVRANKIKDGLKILSYQDNEYLQDFGVKVATEMAMVNGNGSCGEKLCFISDTCIRACGWKANRTPIDVLFLARVLPTPNISYHPSSRMANFVPRDGAWNLKDKKVATGATLGSWGVVVFAQERELPLGLVQGFIRELIVTCIDTGMVRAFLHRQLEN